MTRTDIQIKNDALDLLRKIRALLSAALYLTSNKDEVEMSLELVYLAEKVAATVTEGKE